MVSPGEKVKQSPFRGVKVTWTDFEALAYNFHLIRQLCIASSTF